MLQLLQKIQMSWFYLCGHMLITISNKIGSSNMTLKNMLTFVKSVTTLVKISGQPSVMDNQISHLTEQSFSEICINDRLLNETIWTSKHGKLNLFDLVEEMKRKKFVH